MRWTGSLLVGRCWFTCVLRRWSPCQQHIGALPDALPDALLTSRILSSGCESGD
jgi:hypothetical protein